MLGVKPLGDNSSVFLTVTMDPSSIDSFVVSVLCWQHWQWLHLWHFSCCSSLGSPSWWGDLSSFSCNLHRCFLPLGSPRVQLYEQFGLNSNSTLGVFPSRRSSSSSYGRSIIINFALIRVVWDNPMGGNLQSCPCGAWGSYIPSRCTGIGFSWDLERASNTMAKFVGIELIIYLTHTSRIRDVHLW